MKMVTLILTTFNIMTLPHQKMREIVFIFLFARTSGILNERDTEELIMEQLRVSKSNILKALEKTKAIEQSLTQIDESIQKLLISYDFERIQSVEKAALRLGTYELLFELHLPPKAVISEALRLTKKFGTPAATSFVNAILDAIFKAMKGENTDGTAIQNSWKNLQISNQQANEASESHPPLDPK